MRLFPSGTRYTLAFLLVFQIGSAFAGISRPKSVSGTDRHASDTSSFTFTVLHEEAFSFRIDRENHGVTGFPAKLHVIFDAGTEDMEGFNLLLAYDAAGLTLREIQEGSMFGENGRGSLSHRVEMIDGCSGNCPKGLVHLSGKAKSSSSAVEASLLKTGDTIVILEFVVV